MKSQNFLYTIICLLMVSGSLSAQKTAKFDLYTLHKENKLVLKNRNISLSEEGDRKFIKISESPGDGVIWLPVSDFKNGTLEISARGKDIAQGSFYGIAFHTLNDSTYDGVYCRPFNYKAEDPERKIHAVQYVSYPGFDWQKLRRDFNGVYEKGVANPPKADDWVTLTIHVKDDTVEAYINHAAEPSLVIKKLNNRTGGKIGITGFNCDIEYLKLQGSK